MQTLLTKYRTQRTTGGFSLLELLLVVAVAAVLILAGIAAYTLVTNNQRSTDAKRQVAQIKSTIKTNYSSANYTGLTTTVAGSMGAFTGMRNVTATSTDTPKTPWGGTVSISSNATLFNIAFYTVPRASCTDLAMSMANDQELNAVQVNGTTRLTNFTSAGGVSAVTATNIGTDCNASTNTVLFQFR